MPKDKHTKKKYFVILDYESARVITTELEIPVNCPDVEAYLYEKDIIKPSQVSFMCSDNPIPIESETYEIK